MIRNKENYFKDPEFVPIKSETYGKKSIFFGES